MPRRATSTSFGAKAGNTRNTTVPGSGVPPEAFRDHMRRLVSWTLKARSVEKILKDPDHTFFMKALEYATSHGYGKPKESVEHSGTIEHKHQMWKFGSKEVAF